MPWASFQKAFEPAVDNLDSSLGRVFLEAVCGATSESAMLILNLLVAPKGIGRIFPLLVFF